MHLTVDGEFRVSLAGDNEESLRDKMRRGTNDAELSTAIINTLTTKKAEHIFILAAETVTQKIMSTIDG